MNKEINVVTKPWTGLSWATVLFTSLVCLWTLSHNLDLYDSGLSEKNRVIGRIGCLSAELFVGWAVIQFLRYGGARGRAARNASSAMLAVLLLNTIVASLRTQGKTRGVGPLLEMYSAYGVPIAFAAVIVWGLHHILSNDPESRENDLRADEQELGRDVKMRTQQHLFQSVQTKMQGDEVKKAIELAATELVQRLVSDATQQVGPRRLHLSAGDSAPSSPLTLEAHSVTEIDPHSNHAQYVNGLADNADELSSQPSAPLSSQPPPKSTPHSSRH